MMVTIADSQERQLYHGLYGIGFRMYREAARFSVGFRTVYAIILFFKMFLVQATVTI